ncbi:MAG: gliding motility-associated C-terminal domain-containing protein, partial [Bacteroidales bacterium]|nr:gliding motility-associated C-terminal domain-containing protein [Bacteroidales bacterium]
NIATTTSIGNRPAGTYTFTVTDHVGCTATATVTLNAQNGELTPGTIAASQEVCDGEDIAPFTGTAASGGDNGGYQWQISTNGTDWTSAPGTSNTQGYTYPSPASNAFSLRRAWVSQSCGTVYSNIVTVSVWSNSIDTITASVCQGETYAEYNFDVTADQTVETGVYTYEQHHATGHCDSAVILILTVNPTAAELVEATICEGEGYSANGFSVSPQETIGTGELTRVQNLQTANGCDSAVTLQLTVIDTALRVELLTEDFCEHNEASLTVLSPMPDYVWSTGETATTIVVTSPGLYSVTAMQEGCSATATIRVEGCHYELVLPNAITPSRGDGLNDCFYIPEVFTTNINLFKVYIYNRWGELVFYSTDKNFRWYGEYRGQTQYQTVYNYVIEYTDTSGRPQRLVGSVTVL